MDYMPMLAEAGSLQGHFTWIDWVVVLGYLVFTTILGARLAGKQQTIRDFFLGGRKLPWYAVSGSIIATEISAVTFVGVPAIVFAPGGDFRYLQLGIFGALFSRLIVAYVLVPAYYRWEIYSPYDYMGNRLGRGVRGMTTALFTLGGLLGQSARVYLTALVLELVLHQQLGWLYEQTGIRSMIWAIGIIGVVAILWTILGGIATVIWTDVVLFLVFVIGAITALATIIYRLPDGFFQMIELAAEVGKFRLWDLDPDPRKDFTIWTAIFASTLGSVGAYGTDQLMAQRIFCCKTPREAKLAVVTSWAGQLITASVLLIGAGLFSFYTVFPLVGEAAERYAAEPDRIFPIFILSEIPTGLTGLMIAGIFAAAISSLDSILAALSQTTMSALYLPLRERYLQRHKLARGFEAVGLQGDALTAPENPQGPPGQPPSIPADAITDSGDEDRLSVLISRILVVFWGILLSIAAIVVDDFKERTAVPILVLALTLAQYAHGALIAGFALAFLPLRINGWGFLWSAPLAVITVFSLRWHEPWARWAVWIVCGLLLVSWIWASLARRRPVENFAVKTLILAAGCGMLLLLTYFGYFTSVDDATGEVIRQPIAFPWLAPLGSIAGFAWGYLLADRQEPEAEEQV
jgi:solute:Na+ symporter, SSS family